MTTSPMLRFALLRAGTCLVGLAGVFAFAAAIAALERPVFDARGFFFLWLAKLPHVLQGDFGESTLLGGDALVRLGPVLGATGSILLIALPIALVAGTATGIVSDHRHGRFFTAPLMQILGAVPFFCAAIAVFSFFGNTGIALPPTIGSSGNFGATLGLWAALVILLALTGAGLIAGIVGGAFTRARAEPYREGLSLMGLGDWEITRVFVSRQAAALSLLALGEAATALIGATAIAEFVFAFPGAGTLFLRAAALQDWALLSAFVAVLGAMRFLLDFIGSLSARLLLGEDVP